MSIKVKFFGVIERVVVEGFDEIFGRGQIFNFLDFGVGIVMSNVKATSWNEVMFDLVKMDGACFCTRVTERLDGCTRSIGIECYDSVRS